MILIASATRLEGGTLKTVYYIKYTFSCGITSHAMSQKVARETYERHINHCKQCREEHQERAKVTADRSDVGNRLTTALR